MSFRWMHHPSPAHLLLYNMNTCFTLLWGVTWPAAIHITSFSGEKLSWLIHFQNTAKELNSNRKTKRHLLFLPCFFGGEKFQNSILLNILWIKLIIFFWGFSQLTAVMPSFLWVTAILMLVQGCWCVPEQSPKGCKSWILNGTNVCCESCHPGK